MSFRKSEKCGDYQYPRYINLDERSSYSYLTLYYKLPHTADDHYLLARYSTLCGGGHKLQHENTLRTLRSLRSPCRD